MALAVLVGVVGPARAQLGPSGSDFDGSSGRRGADADPLPEVDKKIADDPQKVFERAQRDFERRDWPSAIAHFEHVKQRFPYQLQLAAESELRLGDIAFAREHYTEARGIYRNFVRFRPTHPRVDYAAFRAGLSAFQNVPGDAFLNPPAIEKDPTDAREALRELREFVETYPASEYVVEARAAMQKSEEFLAAHELYVARFYASRKKWKGVLLRVDTLRRVFPRSAKVPEALLLAVQANVELGQEAEAREALAALEAAGPEAALLEQGRRLVARGR